ncbi:MAG: GIY-YIG nuclease family protein [Patescibacteria group bacterium]
MYYIYILSSLIKRKSYVGCTDDLERRLSEHNSAKNYFTKRHIPWKIIYTESFSEKAEALKREKYFKSSSGRKRLKQIFATI